MTEACEEPHHVMLCYRRVNVEFAKLLQQQLEEAYELDCFRDEDDHKYGHEWSNCWPQQLDMETDELTPDLGPTLVVLATDVNLDDKAIENDVVVKEILAALSPERTKSIPIVLLRFGKPGWEELKARLLAEAKRRVKAGGEDVVTKRIEGIDKELHQPSEFDSDLLKVDSKLPKGGLTDEQWNKICKPIVISVRAYFLRHLKREKDESMRWAEKTRKRCLSTDTEKTEFPRQLSRIALDSAIGELVTSSDKKAVVAVGPGGLGKTMQVAQSILDLKENMLFFPIVLSLDDMGNLDKTLKERFGLAWLDSNRTVSLPDEGLHWFKDKICFVTDSLERADSVDTVAGQLERLRYVAKLLITSRPGAWSKASSTLIVDKSDVVELDHITTADVKGFLEITDDKQVKDRPYLQNPVFLDVARYLNQSGRITFDNGGASNETQLLDALRRFAVEPSTGSVRGETTAQRDENKGFLESLAHLQIDQNRFDVLYDDLKRKGHENAMQFLAQDKSYAIIEVDSDGKKRIRLRHDLIDSHNIAELCESKETVFDTLLGTPGKTSNGKLHLGFGQVIFEGIMQAAHDRGDNDSVEKFFREFLRLVDIKTEGLLAAAWNSGYAINSRFPVFEPLIKKVLAGKYHEMEVPSNFWGPLSTLDNLNTQSAMSSVASMLGGQPAFSIEDDDKSLLKSIVRLIPMVRYNFRLIEALPSINRPDDVIEELTKLAKDSDLIKEDPGVSGYIATALVDAARDSTVHAKRSLEALTALQKRFLEIAKGKLKTTLRDIENAEIAVREIGRFDRIEGSPFGLEEVIEGLGNVSAAILLRTGGDSKRYSDWIMVEKYLRKLRKSEGKIEGKLYDEVVLAIGRCFWHKHVRCRVFAVRTLEVIDHPLARGMLLHFLTFEIDDGTESAIIAGLAKQVKMLLGRVSIAAGNFRLALIRTIACRQRLVGSQRAPELRNLLDSFKIENDALVTEHYVELRRFGAVEIKMLEDRTKPMPELPDWLTSEEKVRDVGEEKEAKLAFRLQSNDDCGLRFIRSSWQKPRRLQKALQSRGDFFRRIAEKYERSADLPSIWESGTDAPVSETQLRSVTEHFRPDWETEWCDRDGPAFQDYVEAVGRRYELHENASEVPSIAVVHAVVLFKDDYVLQAQRSENSTYWPSAWAASFEEQMQLQDLKTTDGIKACLVRGLLEEFGIVVKAQALEIEAVSLGVEWELANTAALVVVRLGMESSDFPCRMDGAGTDLELSDWKFSLLKDRLITVTKSQLEYWADTVRPPIHPTTEARLALVSLVSSV